MFGSPKMKEAKSPYTNYVTLREHAASKRPSLRAAVAANPNLQSHVMVKMTADPVEKVRVALTTNPKLTSQVWDILVEDSSEAVRNSLKEHYPTKPEKIDARKL
jgi:hypothetical protein